MTKSVKNETIIKDHVVQIGKARHSFGGVRTSQHFRMFGHLLKHLLSF